MLKEKSIKILYDHQIFQNQKFGGISRYFYELLNYFESEQSIDYVLPIQYSNNEYLRQMPRFSQQVQPLPVSGHRKRNDYTDFMWGMRFKGKYQLYTLKEKFFPVSKPSQTIDGLLVNKKEAIQKLKEGDFDIFHPTYYSDYFLEHIGNKPYVITVYDLIHQLFPEHFLNDFVDKSQEIVDKAAHILAISESTKRDLVNIYQIDERKVTVTYLANSLSHKAVTQGGSFTEWLPEKYLLYVGNRTQYKNFYFFVQLVAHLLQADSDIYVVCTGSPFSPEETKFFQKWSIHNKVVHRYVDDFQLAYLYKQAQALVFPSQYEGFGLPILEAFSCGCPVIASRNSSLTEVGGEAAVYFEEKNAHSIASSVTSVLKDGFLRDQLIQKGYSQLKKFSWQQTAKDTLQVYKSVLDLQSI